MYIKNPSISIGGVVIAIISDSNKKLYLDNIYKRFVTNTKPDAFLRVWERDTPHCSLGKKVFDSGDFLSIYRSGEKIIMCFHIPNTAAPFPYRMVLNPHFKSVDLYAEPIEHTQNHYFHPLQRPLVELLMMNFLSQGLGVMLHACGIDDNGRGIIFTGPSGSGKSSLANLWKGKDGVTILNDEHIIIRKMEERFWIYGTPWPGDAQLFSQGMCPLEKIFFIEHAKENAAVHKKGVDAVTPLLLQSFPQFWDISGMQFTVSFLAELIREIPCYKLCFVPNESVVDFVRTIL